jgi:hypothetical protein
MRELMDYWPLILFVLAMLGKQIDTHFKVIALEKSVTENEAAIREVESDLHTTIKEQGNQTNVSIQKLTEATSELVVATRVMANQLEDMKRR